MTRHGGQATDITDGRTITNGLTRTTPTHTRTIQLLCFTITDLSLLSDLCYQPNPWFSEL